MSLISEINESGKYLKDAYQALKANGAPLPEKCNMANLAGCIEESGGGDPAGYDDWGTIYYYNDSSVDSIIKISLTTEAEYRKLEVNSSNNYIIICGLSLNPAHIIGFRFGTKCKSAGRQYLAFTGVQFLYGTEHLETIEQGFMYGCSGKSDFNFSFPNVRTIGADFMSSMSYLTGKVTLGDRITSIGTRFMYGRNPVWGPLYVNSGITPPIGDTTALALPTKDYPAYQSGITLSGPGAQAWKTALPDLNGPIYRKLILDPEWS